MNALLKPFHSKEINLKNRVVMAPMTRNRTRNEERIVEDITAVYYAQRASAGLIITEGTHVSSEGIGSLYVPDIYTTEQVQGWKKVTERVHKNDGVIFAQLWHVGRLSHPNILNGNLPKAPSAINPDFKTYGPKGFEETVTPKAFTKAEIQKTIQDFVQGALNAEQAGFDGVELHAANGYLFHQFFMNCSNQRTDEYGGSIENKTRFLWEVLDEIAKVYPLEKVGVRLAPDMDQTFGIVRDEETEATFEYIIKRLNDYPIAYLHISGFSLAAKDAGITPVLERAKIVREWYQGTLMINKGFDSETGHQAIEEGWADLISFGVPFIANPDLVERIAANQAWANADRKTFYGGDEKGYIDFPNFNGELPEIK